MAWTWESTCSACTFVSAQIGKNTPCPGHAGNWSSASELVEAIDPAETIQPTADQPWPFSPHEFARLLVLRGRVRDRRRTKPGGTISLPGMSDDMRTVLAGGLALLLFLLIFAFGQLQEIFRATGYH
jgi:hypothetical protein